VDGSRACALDGDPGWAGTRTVRWVGISGIGRIHAKDHLYKTNPIRPARLNVPEFKTDLPAGGNFFLVPPAFVVATRRPLTKGAIHLHRFVLVQASAPLPKKQPYPDPSLQPLFDSGGNKAKEADVLRSAASAKNLGLRLLFQTPCGSRRRATAWDPARFPKGVKNDPAIRAREWNEAGLLGRLDSGGNSEDLGANIFRHPDRFVQNFNSGLEIRLSQTGARCSIWAVIRPRNGHAGNSAAGFRI